MTYHSLTAFLHRLRRQFGGSDSDNDDEFGEGVFTTNWDLQVSSKRKRWAQKETSLREGMENIYFGSTKWVASSYVGASHRDKTAHYARLLPKAGQSCLPFPIILMYTLFIFA